MKFQILEKKNYFSVHNKNYWTGKEYLGIGFRLAIHLTEKLNWNISNNTKYINHLKKNILPYELEKLKTLINLTIIFMTSLRTMWGVDLNIYGDLVTKYILILNSPD